MIACLFFPCLYGSWRLQLSQPNHSEIPRTKLSASATNTPFKMASEFQPPSFAGLYFRKIRWNIEIIESSNTLLAMLLIEPQLLLRLSSTPNKGPLKQPIPNLLNSKIIPFFIFPKARSPALENCHVDFAGPHDTRAPSPPISRDPLNPSPDSPTPKCLLLNHWKTTWFWEPLRARRSKDHPSGSWYVDQNPHFRLPRISALLTPETSRTLSSWIPRGQGRQRLFRNV